MVVSSRGVVSLDKGAGVGGIYEEEKMKNTCARREASLSLSKKRRGGLRDCQDLE
jgi:hypothetical protein